MTTLSLDELVQVTGGKGPDAASVGITASGSSSSSDAVLSALNSIQSSLKDLGRNNNGGLFGGNNGLMFMAMAVAMSRRSDLVVYGGGGAPGGYSWRAWY